MDVIRLEPGAEAPPDGDCINVVALPDGRYRLVASALFDGDSDGDESVAVVGGDTYPTRDEAEAAGLTWADEQGVRTLYVERSRTPDA